jgi:hypothetical protein
VVAVVHRPLCVRRLKSHLRNNDAFGHQSTAYTFQSLEYGATIESACMTSRLPTPKRRMARHINARRSHRSCMAASLAKGR